MVSGVHLLASGSRWSKWFCPGCRTKVDGFNSTVGRPVVPVGRHSFMNRVGIASSEVNIPLSMQLFVRDLYGLVDTIMWLQDWAATTVGENLEVVGCGRNRSTPLGRYLGLVRDDKAFASRPSFDRLLGGLTEWMGSR